MRTLVIINNIAARARRAWPEIEKQLAMAGIEYEVYKTNGPADATIQTRAALKAGTTTAKQLKVFLISTKTSKLFPQR